MKAYINPYNFIPHSGKVGRTPSAEAPGQLVTGEIRCSLTVKTPLAVPDASERLPVVLENGKDRHYVYPFMCAGGVPIIPGSELRGMVRSIYETVTNSCFSIINTNTLSKRDKDPLPEAGLLQWNAALGIWQLFKANRRSYFTPSTLNAAKARLEAQGTDEMLPYASALEPFSSATSGRGVAYFRRRLPSITISSTSSCFDCSLS